MTVFLVHLDVSKGLVSLECSELGAQGKALRPVGSKGPEHSHEGHCEHLGFYSEWLG